MRDARCKMQDAPQGAGRDALRLGRSPGGAGPLRAKGKPAGTDLASLLTTVAVTTVAGRVGGRARGGGGGTSHRSCGAMSSGSPAARGGGAASSACCTCAAQGVRGLAALRRSAAAARARRGRVLRGTWCGRKGGSPRESVSRSDTQHESPERERTSCLGRSDAPSTATRTAQARAGAASRGVSEEDGSGTRADHTLSLAGACGADSADTSVLIWVSRASGNHAGASAHETQGRDERHLAAISSRGGGNHYVYGIPYAPFSPCSRGCGFAPPLLAPSRARPPSAWARTRDRSRLGASP
jgi:hypothetical protein